MNVIEKERKSIYWGKIIAIVLVLSIILSCSGYILYLRNTLEDTCEKLETVNTEKNLVENRMAELENELRATNDKLNITYGVLENHFNKFREYEEEINALKKAIVDDEEEWRKRYEEYPTATEVWLGMKSLGFSDITCAGIMGNLMAETGGSGTFYLNWDSNSESGYGLVQWLGGRRIGITDRYGEFPTVKDQVQFMYDELHGTNSVRRQVSDTQFDAIMNAESPEDCAYAFACYYERCATSVRNKRMRYARKAYEYFVE